MDVLTFETCRAVNSEIIKQVTSVGLSLFKYKKNVWLQQTSSGETNVFMRHVVFVTLKQVDSLKLQDLMS